MTKTLNQIIIFFLHQNQNIFFSNIGYQNIFLEKNHWFIVFDATLKNISVKSWWSVLLVEQTGGPGENHRLAAGH